MRKNNDEKTAPRFLHIVAMCGFVVWSMFVIAGGYLSAVSTIGSVQKKYEAVQFDVRGEAQINHKDDGALLIVDGIGTFRISGNTPTEMEESRIMTISASVAKIKNEYITIDIIITSALCFLFIVLPFGVVFIGKRIFPRLVKA